jgi:hypothetical protein
MENKRKIQEKLMNASPPMDIHEEFGTEFTGDMNAAKLYDVLASTKNKNKNKK